MNMHAKRYLMVLGFIFLLQSVCFASDLKIFKKSEYDLTLESKSIPANNRLVEYFDIDNLGDKIPDQIFTTVQTGDWISTLPGNIFITDSSNIVDSISEYWEVNFANIKSGRILFARIIINSSDTDKDSYSWNLKIKCKYAKFR